MKAEGQRLTYGWDADVQEWFVNDPRGLEHGFTRAGAAPGREPLDTQRPRDLDFLSPCAARSRPQVPADAGRDFSTMQPGRPCSTTPA